MGLNYEELGEEYEDSLRREIHLKHKSPHSHKNHSSEDLKKEIQTNSESAVRKYVNNVFEKWEEPVKTEKLEAYRSWVQESLKDNYPVFEEEDLTRKEGAGWVKITHTPTLYGAIGSGEETRYLNDRTAQINVFNLIYNHFNLWKETSDAFKKELGVSIQPNF